MPKRAIFSKSDDPAAVNMRQYDPFLRPEWRYERILKLIDAVPVPRRTTRRDDNYIREGRAYLLKWRATNDEIEREVLVRTSPSLATAWDVYRRIDTDPEVAFTIEALLLANMEFSSIADAVKTRPEVIEWYEALFFNVRPYLRHYGWIYKHVLLPAIDRFVLYQTTESEQIRRLPVLRPHLDMTLKFFAYFGGPVLAEFMLTGFKRGVVRTADEIEEWLDQAWTSQIRRRSTISAGVFEINRFNVMELFSTHARIIELSKGAGNQGQRRTEFEKHIQTMLSQIPWTTGSTAKQAIDETPIGQYDDISAELRDEELLLVAAGERLTTTEELPQLVVSTSDKESKGDGNVKQ